MESNGVLLQATCQTDQPLKLQLDWTNALIKHLQKDHSMLKKTKHLLNLLKNMDAIPGPKVRFCSLWKKKIFASGKNGAFDEEFSFCFGLENDLISSASGRAFSSILFFFEYFRALQGASDLFPSESVIILFEIEAFHLFLILLSVLPGIRSAIVDHLGPYLNGAN